MMMNPLEKITNNYDLRSFIIKWNNEYHWDYLWRKKYNVSFGDERHLSMTFIDMRLDLLEDLLYKNAINKSKKKDLHTDRLLRPKKQEYEEFTDDELDHFLENMDLDKFKDDQT